MDRGAVAVQVGDVLVDAALEVELILGAVALVLQGDPDIAVQEGQFPDPVLYLADRISVDLCF